MIIWGGDGVGGRRDLNSGGKYNPLTDSWQATSSVGSPAGKDSHQAVWTGEEMIIYGGRWYKNILSIYNPSDLIFQHGFDL